MTYKAYLVEAITADICGFAELTGDFYARDKVRPRAIAKLGAMSENALRDIALHRFGVLRLAEELLKDMELSIR